MSRLYQNHTSVVRKAANGRCHVSPTIHYSLFTPQNRFHCQLNCTIGNQQAYLLDEGREDGVISEEGDLLADEVFNLRELIHSVDKRVLTIENRCEVLHHHWRKEDVKPETD